MSGSVTSSTGTAAAASSGTGSVAAQTGSVALNSLSSNFSDFLTLLMTQLQNQDPSSPMDSNQFTSELVQFSSVEQQINTNSDLTQLIQLTQASQVEQSSAMLGKPVTVNSTQLSNSSATVNFNTTAAEPIVITVTNASGAQVAQDSITSTAGSNTWQWSGKATNGTTLPAGAYTVSVATLGSNRTTTAVPFTVTGTATGVINNSGTVEVQMGNLTLPFSDVVSVGN
jgi:flagellar basal-body rod modification protein FlgD